MGTKSSVHWYRVAPDLAIGRVLPLGRVLTSSTRSLRDRTIRSLRSSENLKEYMIQGGQLICVYIMIVVETSIRALVDRPCIRVMKIKPSCSSY